MKISELKIQRLNLDYWMTYLDPEEYEIEVSYHEITGSVPVFKNDGKFYSRKLEKYWFQRDQRAWAPKESDDGDLFKYELSLLNSTPLTAEQEKAIVILSQTLPKKEKALLRPLLDRLYVHRALRNLRNLKRTVSLIKFK